jgi:hypothetical protein
MSLPCAAAGPGGGGVRWHRRQAAGTAHTGINTKANTTVRPPLRRLWPDGCAASGRR